MNGDPVNRTTDPATPAPKRYDCGKGRATYCYGCYTMEESEYGDYVRYEDVEKLLREPPAPRLTRDDELFIATRLLARARHQSKKLLNAEGKTLHPQLLEEMRTDIERCTRLALLLQQPAGSAP